MNSSGSAVLPRVALKTDRLAECCIKCRFWFHGAAQPIQGQNGQPGGMVAPCRRYPPTVVVVAVPVGGNPRVIDPRTGAPQHAQIQQQPMPAMTVTPAVDWCGEFSAAPMPAAE